ncbi:EthD domain-containing protein [Myxococcota bacterium]|nr:EthD domain-containing protein [Myxococcota bacterium]
MIKTIALIARRPDLAQSSFRNHYESQHVSLAVPLLPSLKKYVRNHRLDGDLGPGIFDCMTEFWYPDPAELSSVVARLDGPEGHEIRADELRFMDKARNTFFLADEALIEGPERQEPLKDVRKFVLWTPQRPTAAATDEIPQRLCEELLPRLIERVSALRCTQDTPRPGPNPAPVAALASLWCPAQIDGIPADLSSDDIPYQTCEVTEHETPLQGP